MNEFETTDWLATAFLGRTVDVTPTRIDEFTYADRDTWKCGHVKVNNDLGRVYADLTLNQLKPETAREILALVARDLEDA